MGTYYREYNKECNETGDKTLGERAARPRHARPLEGHRRPAPPSRGFPPAPPETAAWVRPRE
jgi:hypothetical protein